MIKDPTAVLHTALGKLSPGGRQEDHVISIFTSQERLSPSRDELARKLSKLTRFPHRNVLVYTGAFHSRNYVYLPPHWRHIF